MAGRVEDSVSKERYGWIGIQPDSGLPVAQFGRTTAGYDLLPREHPCIRMIEWTGRACQCAANVQCPQGLALVVPHKLGGRNFFGSGPKSVPCVGQVVATLQSDPKSLGAGLVFWPIHEAT